ncbi:MAG: hypothetical protein PHU25_01670 [Deltaproteobacteria bacterium]|nr:hypothetical protein [Deltaproteobacteria bacterium]
MAKIRHPRLFSKYFNIDPARLASMGIMDPVLNVDTKLFIDPLLLSRSSHQAIATDAPVSFRKYFENIIRLLRSTRCRDDVAWREVTRRLLIREVKWTCIGYGASSIRGRRSARSLTDRLVQTAKEIVDLGITDPELFSLLPLIEDGIGPDLISDLTTVAILNDLAAFTAQIALHLSIPTRSFTFGDHAYQLPVNPTERKLVPVLLLPRDILSALPVASDWSEVADAAAKTSELRRRVNRLIGNIWAAKTRKEKAFLRSTVLSSREAFQTLLDTVRQATTDPYDIDRDTEGLFKWRSVFQTVATQYPLPLSLAGPPSAIIAKAVVDAIVAQFQSLVEDKGLWKLLWNGNKPHREKVSQMLFFAVAESYCQANNIDVTPEADTGSGPVDFKFSSGYSVRILVEVKLSNNPKLIQGYKAQLETYKASQRPVHAIYLVIDVGKLGDKDQKLLDVKNVWNFSSPVSEVIFVDGNVRLSASQRRA